MKLSGRATGGAFGVIGRFVVVVTGDVIEDTNSLGEDASGPVSYTHLTLPTILLV